MREENWNVKKVLAVRNELRVIADPGPGNSRNRSCRFRFILSDEQMSKLAHKIECRMTKVLEAGIMMKEFEKFLDESHRANEVEKHRLAKAHGIEIDDFHSGLYFY